MKTLIIGARGMLGHELAQTFAKYNPTLWDMSDIDITQKFQVHEKISALRPELIINAAAYTAVDKCEQEEELAMRVNGEAVGYLAEISKQLGATLVHYSTDYVFDGNKKQGYVENDEPNPQSAYGRSKLEGEKAILSVSSRGSASDRGDPVSGANSDGIASSASTPPRNDTLKFYIIRTAWLFGVHGKNFVEAMLSKAQAGEPLKVVNDQFGCPTYAPDLAKATLDIIESKKPYGIYHRTNDGQTTWYEFAKEIFSVFGFQCHCEEPCSQGDAAIPSKNQKIVNLSACATEEYPTPAKRPKYSVMRSTKLEPMRPWQEALEDYKINHK